MVICKVIYVVPCKSIKRKGIVKIEGKKVVSKDRKKVCTTKETIKVNHSKKALLLVNIRPNPPHSCHCIPRPSNS